MAITPEEADRRVKQKWGPLSYLMHDKDEDRWRVYSVASAKSGPHEVGHGASLEEALALAQIDAGAAQPEPQPKPSRAPTTDGTYYDVSSPRRDDLLERAGLVALEGLFGTLDLEALTGKTMEAAGSLAAVCAKAFVAELRKVDGS